MPDTCRCWHRCSSDCGIDVSTINPVILEDGVAQHASNFVPYFPDQNLHFVRALSRWIPISMDHNPVIGLIYKVRRTGDVVQPGGLPPPLLQLAWVRHEPDVDPSNLSKPLDLGQHVAHILCLTHISWSLMIQLVVRIDHKASNAVSVRDDTCDVNHQALWEDKQQSLKFTDL